MGLGRRCAERAAIWSLYHFRTGLGWLRTGSLRWPSGQSPEKEFWRQRLRARGRATGSEFGYRDRNAVGTLADNLVRSRAFPSAGRKAEYRQELVGGPRKDRTANLSPMHLVSLSRSTCSTKMRRAKLQSRSYMAAGEAGLLLAGSSAARSSSMSVRHSR